MESAINSATELPMVYKAVWAVGILKPKFNPNGAVFANQLDVIGTAAWLKNEKVLITCAHVVQSLLGAPLELTGLLVVGQNGNYTPAKIGVIDLMHDLAVLKIDNQEIANQQTEGLEISETYHKVGTKIGYAGFPLGMQLLQERHAPTYNEGLIGSEIKNLGIRKEIQISGAVTGGFSGSPIIALGEPTKIIGIVSNSPSKEAGDANIFMGISWEHIKALAAVPIS